MADYVFTHKRGEILESRALSETHVSGSMQNGRGNISSSTTHFNRCRIKWDGGGEEFVDCYGSYSVGDKVAIIYEKGKKINDLNINTREHQKLKIQIGCLMAIACFVSFCLIFFIGIGIVTSAALGWWIWDTNKKRNAALSAYVAQIQ